MIIKFEKILRSSAKYEYSAFDEGLEHLLKLDRNKIINKTDQEIKNKSNWSRYKGCNSRACKQNNRYECDGIRHTPHGWILIKERVEKRSFGATSLNTTIVTGSYKTIKSIITDQMNENLVVNQTLYIPGLKASLEWEHLKIIYYFLFQIPMDEQSKAIDLHRTNIRKKIKGDLYSMFKVKNDPELIHKLYSYNINNMVYTLNQHGLIGQ